MNYSSLRLRVAVCLVPAIAFCPSFQRLSAQSSNPTPQTYVPNPPTEWVDKDTGHKITRLTNEPLSRGLYFNEKAFTPDGKEMIYLVKKSIYVMDMTSKHPTRQLVEGPIDSLVLANKTPSVYFIKDGDTSLYAADVTTGQVAKVINLPAHATISTVNADDTLAAGFYIVGDGIDKLEHKPNPNLKPSSVRATAMDERLAAHLPMVLFTIDLKTATMHTVLQGTDWLNHVQFSPKDPTLLMYCHEGLWQRVDRIWTIRTDGTHNELVHKRTMNDEIAGHEFWDADGKTIWYDLQAPKGEIFYLAGYNTETKARTWYTVDRDAWSIHYNAAADDSVFAGDGGDYSQVAKSKNGQWIELFTPHQNPAPPEVDQTGLVQSGFMVPQHLVNMEHQNYTLEPNVRFSPDHKLVIFTSNMFGPSYIFAVDVRHARPPAAGATKAP